MIGRAAIGYPWFFNEVKHFFKTGIFSKTNNCTTCRNGKKTFTNGY